MSRLIPTRRQWSAWTLPSKATYVAAWLGLFGLVIVIAQSLSSLRAQKPAPEALPFEFVQVITSWGIEPPNKINMVVETAPISHYADEYDMAAICRVRDDTLDFVKDSRILKSGPFEISGIRQTISLTMDPPFLDQLVSTTLSVQCTLVLLPKLTSLEDITSLDDVRKAGGIIHPTTRGATTALRAVPKEVSKPEKSPPQEHRPYLVLSPKKLRDSDVFLRAERRGNELYFWMKIKLENAGDRLAKDISVPKSLAVTGKLKEGTPTSLRVPPEITLGPGEAISLATTLVLGFDDPSTIETDLARTASGDLWIGMSILVRYFGPGGDGPYRSEVDFQFRSNEVTILRSKVL